MLMMKHMWSRLRSIAGPGRVRTRVRARPGLVLPALLAVGLVSTAVLPQHASAMLVPCRSDPAVVLSNLSILDLSATISDSTSDVQEVLYVLHGPVGTGAIAVNPTLGLLGPKERFQYVADQPANTYRTDTYVSTGAKTVPVVATADVVSVTGLLATHAVSVSGYNAQDLRISLKAGGLLGLL